MKKAILNSFVMQFLAALTGKTDEATAQNQFRKASSNINAQIHVKRGETVNLELALEAAKEQQALARVNNGKDITDGNRYVAGLIAARNNVVYAEDALAQHVSDIAFLEAELAAIEAPADIAEVEAE